MKSTIILLLITKTIQRGKEKTKGQAVHSGAPLMALLLLIIIRRGSRPLCGWALIRLLSLWVLFLLPGP